MSEQNIIIVNIHNISTKTKLTNALTKKGASTKKLLDFWQKSFINIWNQLSMFSSRWNKCHEINWRVYGDNLFNFQCMFI